MMRSNSHIYDFDILAAGCGSIRTSYTMAYHKD